jgi:hypothetical protein
MQVFCINCKRALVLVQVGAIEQDYYCSRKCIVETINAFPEVTNQAFSFTLKKHYKIAEPIDSPLQLKAFFLSEQVFSHRES